jgi:hypothetical protein
MKSKKGVAGIGYGPGYGSGFSGSVSLESGQLSLPINVTIDGIPHTYKTLLLNNRESAHLSLLYRKIPVKVPAILSLIIILLAITAGAFLTACFWSGWTVQKLVYGIVLPMIAALILCRILGSALNLNWVLIVPALFFLWKATMYFVRSVKASFDERKERVRKVTVEIEREGNLPEQNASPSQETGETTDHTPPPIKGGKDA